MSFLNPSFSSSLNFPILDVSQGKTCCSVKECSESEDARYEKIGVKLRKLGRLGKISKIHLYEQLSLLGLINEKELVDFEKEIRESQERGEISKKEMMEMLNCFGLTK